MLDIILGAIKSAFAWFLGVLSSIGSAVIGWIMGLIPASDTTGLWNTCRFGLDAANDWVPLDLAISFIVLYVSFLLTFLLVKILIKMIP